MADLKVGHYIPAYVGLKGIQHDGRQLGPPEGGRYGRTFRGGSRIEEVSFTANRGDHVFTLNVYTNGG